MPSYKCYYEKISAASQDNYKAINDVAAHAPDYARGDIQPDQK